MGSGPGEETGHKLCDRGSDREDDAIYVESGCGDQGSSGTSDRAGKGCRRAAGGGV